MSAAPVAMAGPVTPGAALRARAEQVAQQFEKIFTQTLVATLREEASIGGGEPMFGSGPGADTYAMWFDDLMAERLTELRSIGLADRMLADWERLGQIPPNGGNDVRA
jgi:Rod binding domain-containing protein